MKKLHLIIGIIALGIIALSSTSAFAQALRILTPPQGGTGIGSATAGQVGLCLKVLDDSPFAYELGTCGGGGGADGNWTFFNGSGIRLSTTTNQVLVGASATTTLQALEVIGGGYFSTNLGIGTTTPGQRLSVAGDILGNHLIGSYFTATSSSVASVFPLANITKLSNLTSNGFVKTGSGDGTLSVDTTTYESGLTAGDGLTRTANDFDCDTASGSVFGCLTSADWTTFNNKQATIATTFPITLSGATIGFGGLSTTSPWTIGQLAYVANDNTLTSVATGTISGSSQISATANRYAIGGALALDIVADSIGDTQLAFNTGQALTTASSPTFAGLTLSGLSDGCLNSTSGVIGSTGSACGSGGGGGSGNSKWATSTAEAFSIHSANALRVGIGTTTPQWGLQIATSSGDGTRPQLALTDSSAGTNLKHWTMRSAGGNLYFATSSDAYATSTIPALMIDTNGRVGIGTTSPFAKFSVSGNANFDNSSSTLATAGTLWVGGVNITGDIVYSPSTSGTLIDNVRQITAPSATALAYTTRQLTSGANAYNWQVRDSGGNTYTAVSVNNAITSSNGNTAYVGIGTTTPRWKLQVQGNLPQFALTDSSAGTNLKHWTMRSAGGNLYFATSTDAFATSSIAALTINSNNGNVGVGTTTPVQSLSSTGNLFIGGTGTSTFMGGLQVAGRINSDTASSTINGLIIPSQGLRISTLDCSGSTSLVQTDSSGNFICGTDDSGVGGGITAIQENNSDVVSAATTIDFLGSDFDVSLDGASEGDIAIDYTNSAIARKSQDESITGNWNVSKWLGLGTTTPRWQLQVASSTAPQLALSDGSLTSNHWTMRNAGGNLYLSTSSPSTFATTTPSAFTLLGSNGNVGIGGSDDPLFPLTLDYNPTANASNTIAISYANDRGAFLSYDDTNNSLWGTYLTNNADKANNTNSIAKWTNSQSIRLGLSTTDNDSGIGFYTDGGLTANQIFTPTQRAIITRAGNVGVSTTTPGTLLSLGNTGNDTINISPTATSTFGSGINIRTGCYAINGTCVQSGRATSSIPLFNSSTIPDGTGNTWFEPSSVSGTNDNFKHLVAVASSSASKAVFYGSIRIPDDYVGNPLVKIVWSCPITSCGDAVFDFDYRAVGGDDAESLDQATFQESVTVTDSSSATANNRMVAMVALTGSNISAGDTLQYSIGQDAADAADTYTSDLKFEPDTSLDYRNY